MSFQKPWGNYLLDAIVETKAPDTISFWPQTIAWQLIFALLIMVFIKKSFQAWRNYQKNAYRREALSWLAQCSLANDKDIRQLPALLRKTALLAIVRQVKDSDTLENKALAIKIQQEVTELRGETWVKWLDQHCSKSCFYNEKITDNTIIYSCEQLLSQLAYMPKMDLNDDTFNSSLIKLRQQIELWIKYHGISVDAMALLPPTIADGVSP